MDRIIQVRRFAVATSSGPDVVNLQLASWCRAVRLYREFSERFSEADGDLYADVFETATVAVILAGTSVSQLLGQNADPTRQPPPPVVMLDNLVGADPKGAPLLNSFRDCNKLYNDLRHFGSRKHANVESIAPPKFAQFFSVCQNVWLYVLEERYGRNKGEDEDIDTHLSYQFDVEDE